MKTLQALDLQLLEAGSNGDGDFYRESFAEGALLAFPAPLGVLTKAACIEAIDGNPAPGLALALTKCGSFS